LLATKNDIGAAPPPVLLLLLPELPLPEPLLAAAPLDELEAVDDSFVSLSELHESCASATTLPEMRRGMSLGVTVDLLSTTFRASCFRCR
jgi:hypothetical protein